MSAEIIQEILAQPEAFAEVHGLEQPLQVARQTGAAQHLALIESGEVLAQASLWPRTIHVLDGKRVGFIGNFSAAHPDAARKLLNAACERLKAAGAELALGPLNGSTWHSYRFMTGSTDALPPFLLEPTNPGWYPELWQEEGFASISEYYSALAEHLHRTDPQVARARERLLARGVEIAQLDVANWDQELADVHGLSLIAFVPNFLYEPIPLEHFTALYAKARPLVDERLVLMARHAGRLVGYCFCLPNPPAPYAFIIKTLAVLPGREYAGLGAVLVEQVQQAAAAMGLTHGIHALMHEGNRSRNLSSRYGEPFRTYALYGKALE